MDAYPEPPSSLDSTWGDLERYASVRLLADVFAADEKMFGLPPSDPTELWAQAERVFDGAVRDGAGER